jgi:hypothetical protein
MKNAKITVIDKKALNHLRALIQERLDQLGQELGVALDLGRGNYSNEDWGHFSKLSIAVFGENGEAETPEARDFKDYANLYGMEASDLGMEFSSNGSTFVLCGLKTRGRKYPFIAKKTSDGKTYKFTEEGIVQAKQLNALKAAKAVN